MMMWAISPSVIINFQFSGFVCCNINGISQAFIQYPKESAGAEWEVFEIFEFMAHQLTHCAQKSSVNKYLHIDGA